jgi:hypothetical protein
LDTALVEGSASWEGDTSRGGSYMATQCPCLPRVLRRRNARIAFLRIRGPPHTRGSCDFLGTPGTGLSKRFYVGIPFPGVSYIIKKVFSKYIPKPHLRVGCRVGAMRLQAGRMQSPGCRLQAAMAHSGHVQHGSAGCQAAGGKVQVEGWIGMRSARNIASHSFPVPLERGRTSPSPARLWPTPLYTGLACSALQTHSS